jgi:hypothetical protein
MSKARPLTNTDKDFGRRLYASDKGYTEQMKEVTDKAKLDVKPFHLSEFKKPYLTDDYVEMEHQYSPVGGIPPVPPSLPDNPESDTTEGRMRWKVEPPDEGEPEHWYLVEVWNRVKEQTTTLNGKTTKYKRTYYPAWFEMKNTETGTKGFKLEISLPSAVLDATGEIRGFYAGNNVWYDVKADKTVIKAILAYLHEKGTTQAFTTARLTLDADAGGEVEIKAKDGKTELKKITVCNSYHFWWGCWDPVSNGYRYVMVDDTTLVIKPSVVAQLGGFMVAPQVEGEFGQPLEVWFRSRATMISHVGDAYTYTEEWSRVLTVEINGVVALSATQGIHKEIDFSSGHDYLSYSVYGPRVCPSGFSYGSGGNYIPMNFDQPITQYSQNVPILIANVDSNFVGRYWHPDLSPNNYYEEAGTGYLKYFNNLGWSIPDSSFCNHDMAVTVGANLYDVSNYHIATAYLTYINSLTGEILLTESLGHTGLRGRYIKNDGAVQIIGPFIPPHNPKYYELYIDGVLHYPQQLFKGKRII